MLLFIGMEANLIKDLKKGYQRVNWKLKSRLANDLRKEQLFALNPTKRFFLEELNLNMFFFRRD